MTKTTKKPKKSRLSKEQWHNAMVKWTGIVGSLNVSFAPARRELSYHFLYVECPFCASYQGKWANQCPLFSKNVCGFCHTLPEDWCNYKTILYFLHGYGTIKEAQTAAKRMLNAIARTNPRGRR